MKKVTYFAGISVAALLMLLPVVNRVNPSLGNLSAGPAVVMVADGWPLPPQPTQSAKTSTLSDLSPAGAVMVADGWPLPPQPPVASDTPVAV
jgi:hypothetical protein